MWNIVDSADVVVGSFQLTPATEPGIASSVMTALSIPYGVTVHCAASGADWVVTWLTERVTVTAAN